MIAAAVADDDPPFRQLVGDADVLDRHAPRTTTTRRSWMSGRSTARSSPGRYTALSGIDYWA